MVTDLIPCREFPEAFHPLACAFAEDPAFVDARFPSTAEFRRTPQSLLRPPLAPAHSEGLVRALRESTLPELSPLQQQHFHELASGSAFAVVTGQQVGFLGGALYTALKAVAAVVLAHQLRQQLARPVVPIFWVEDNDSDGREAGTILWWAADGSLYELCAASDAELRQPLASSDRILHPGGLWQEALERILPEVPEELAQILRQAYRPGNSWSSAFTALMQWFLADTGILFLRSSQARQHGLFIPLLERALEAHTELAAALATATSWLQKHGYPVPIVPSLPLLHFHTPEGYRYRIRRLSDGSYTIAQRRYSETELRELFRAHPTAFAPTALLRPLCQDALMPSIAVVLGPGELAYWSQLRELYAALQIPMPAVFLRPSATVIPPVLQRWLARSNWNARSFLAPWDSIERRLLTELPLLQEVERSLAALREHIEQWYEQSLSPVRQTDTTLLPSLGATRHRLEEALQRWERRFRAALRRRADTLLQRARRIWAFLYPNGHPQERLLGWLQLGTLCGFEQLRHLLSSVATVPPAVHAIVFAPAQAAAPAASPAAHTVESPPQ